MFPDTQINKQNSKSASNEADSIAPDAISSVPSGTQIATPDVVQETTQFVDQNFGQQNVMVSSPDATFVEDQIEVGLLKDFLARPTLIHEVTLTEGVPLSVSAIEPWYLFFNDPIIKRKIDNYAFVNCKLHLKIMINSTPFLYGAFLANYEPLVDFGYNMDTTNDNDLTTTERTTSPHIWVLPQSNSGGDLLLPFFYDTDWLELTSASDLQAMGKLILSEVVALQAANGSSGQTCSVQIYAWAEDVKLSGPTYEVAVQSNFGASERAMVANKGSQILKAVTAKGWDEYVKRPVSAVSSTAAAIASTLTDVPVIGVFAKATQIGANAVSKVAALFGWTNVPVIDNVHPVRHEPYHALSSAHIGVPADVMAMDPKTELCVDPRTVGLSGEDEMAFKYIAGKEAYIGAFNWLTSDAVDVDLFNLPVSPANYNVAQVGSTYEYAFTPAAMLANNFKYWRGDVIIRLKFIASKYHCGRVRIVWDPKANLNSVPGNTNTSLNRVVDISEEEDVEIRIPFNQARHFLETPTVEVFRYLGVSGGIVANYYDPRYFNGTLHGYVLNTLSAPETTASVTVLMFARMADNVEFAVPTTRLDGTFSYFEPQSSNMAYDHDDAANQEHYNVYFGQSVRSLRPVLRKAYPSESLVNTLSGTPTDSHRWVSYTRMVFPQFNGYDPTAPYNLRNLGGTADVPGGLSINSPFTTMIPCYKGMRGSMYWHYEGAAMTGVQHRSSFEIARLSADPPLVSSRLASVHSGTVANTSLASQIVRAEYFVYTLDGSQERTGQTLACGSELDGKSILCPNMFNYRFDTTRVSAMSTGQNRKRVRNESYRLVFRSVPDYTSEIGTEMSKDIFIRRYYSVGPDFAAFFFLCVPKMYRYASIPPPANADP